MGTERDGFFSIRANDFAEHPVNSLRSPSRSPQCRPNLVAQPSGLFFDVSQSSTGYTHKPTPSQAFKQSKAGGHASPNGGGKSAGMSVHHDELRTTTA
ncbi:unnamed protein product [Protopolystoma xenopodis]|uniref:Uncharacterized protein n=1 Tax=Protopolystoma xenopodis TaxID=117903 RepID=A0A448XH45_9PLAT|nr:unnamed protein product [Protopolystoma xenopodis]